MKISVIGSGYVGLVAGTCFADLGHEVWCIDNNEKKIADLKEARVPIYEPGLSEMISKNYSEGRMHFTTDLADAICKTDVFFIAVGTPSKADGQADLSAVLAVAAEIGRALNNHPSDKPVVIVNKSTVPVGTADLVTEKVSAETKKEFYVVSNPEFLKEGVAIKDFMQPERIIIGADNPISHDIMAELYKPLADRFETRILYMSAKSAEITKYACNAFLATKISFANEVANLCDKIGANYNEVRVGMGSDSRIGEKFLYAGIGFGGSCFPKDVRALVNTARQYNADLDILDQVETVNTRQKQILLDKVINFYGSQNLKNLKLAVWGLAFKPQTDDMREAPSIPTINGLLEQGVKITAFDPVAVENASHIFKDVIAAGSISLDDRDMYALLEGADGLLVMTDWEQFKTADLKKMAAALKQPVVFDGRNIYEPAEMKEASLQYFCIGNNVDA